jgi:L-2-hydroxyglutarate oxidase LhgO
MKEQLEADVVIIGAGATGTGVARELSRYKLETIVVEKADYIGAGQTKASPGTLYGEGLMQVGSYIMKSIMAPDAPLYDPQSLRLKLMTEGVVMWPRILDELDVEHEDQPTLVIAQK